MATSPSFAGRSKVSCKSICSMTNRYAASVELNPDVSAREKRKVVLSAHSMGSNVSQFVVFCRWLLN